MTFAIQYSEWRHLFYREIEREDLEDWRSSSEECLFDALSGQDETSKKSLVAVDNRANALSHEPRGIMLSLGARLVRRPTRAISSSAIAKMTVRGIWGETQDCCVSMLDEHRGCCSCSSPNKSIQTPEVSAQVAGGNGALLLLTALDKNLGI